MTENLQKSEAEERAGSVAHVAYDLSLELTEGASTYVGDTTIRFTYTGTTGVFLDFTGGDIERMTVNGEDVTPDRAEDRLLLAHDRLGPTNEVRVQYENRYDHTGEGFHQFFDPEDDGEYLYTQFEPYAAHRLFPCFDQPDLKATFEVDIAAPAAWEVTTASRIVDTEELADGRVRRIYEKTVPFSPYLQSVVAGPYVKVEDEHNGVPMAMYCRASLVQFLDADELFGYTKAGMDFFSDFFDTPYPFTKYDQVFVPEFNWGGMENVGNVVYADSYLFRDPPTENQRLSRAEVFFHELAHMWFGDLVTMTWWDDLWLNESFASYMAYLAVDQASPFDGAWQDFHADMKLWAYQQDQLPTTHKIADDVVSTEDAFLNFDGITYGKGASALKQLVATVGADAFQAGMRAYFRDFSFKNARLSDFLAAVSLGSGVDLAPWSAAWLETPGVNTLAMVKGVDGWRLEQSAPAEYPTLRPHTVRIGFTTETDGALSTVAVPAIIDSESIAIDAPIDDPVFVFPNYDDLDYAKVHLDEASLQFATSRVNDIDDALLRQMTWATLWEMVRDQEFSSAAFLAMINDKGPTEANLHSIRLMTNTATTATSRFTPEVDIAAAQSRFVAAGLRALEVAPEGDDRVLWLRAMIANASSPADLITMAEILDGTYGADVAVDQNMRWNLATRWSAFGLEGWQDRAQSELVRDHSDRGLRNMVSIEVAQPDAEAKAFAWKKIHGEGYGSLYMDLAAMRGFNWRHQRELLEPYVERFFAGLPRVFAEHGHEYADRYFDVFFPWYRIDNDVRNRIATMLSTISGPPMLVRQLREAADQLDRAMRCRAVAASGG